MIRRKANGIQLFNNFFQLGSAWIISATFDKIQKKMNKFP